MPADLDSPFAQVAASGAVYGAVGFMMENTPLGQGKSFEAMVARTAIQAAAGGTASVLSGGKFADGAITGAMAQLYNDSGLALDDQEAFEVAVGSCSDGTDDCTAIYGRGGLPHLNGGAAGGHIIRKRTPD